MEDPCYLCNKLFLCNNDEKKKCLQRKLKQKMELKKLKEMMK